MVVDAEPHGHLREGERKALIKTTAMAPNATDDEFKLFLAVADRLGLDPLTRQIYAIHRRNGKDDHGRDKYQMTIQTGIDGFAAIAERTKVYAGADDIVFDVEDAEHPNKAMATVYRIVQGMRVPFTASARWSEYAQRKPVWRDKKPVTDANGHPVYELIGKWADMPYNMLGKCALAKALRMAFPVQLSGIYTDDEMDQADNPLPVVTAATAVAHTARTATVRPTSDDKRAAFNALRERAIAAGMHEDDWELVCQQVAGTADHTRMREPGKRALIAYVERMEHERAAQTEAQAEAQAAADDADYVTDADFEQQDEAQP